MPDIDAELEQEIAELELAILGETARPGRLTDDEILARFERLMAQMREANPITPEDQAEEERVTRILFRDLGPPPVTDADRIALLTEFHRRLNAVCEKLYGPEPAAEAVGAALDARAPAPVPENPARREAATGRPSAAPASHGAPIVAPVHLFRLRPGH